MSRYQPTPISIGYPSILDNKVGQFFSSKIYPNKVTSSKVHLTQIHFHIALVLPLGNISLNQLYQTRR
jgi:hypothetical protein